MAARRKTRARRRTTSNSAGWVLLPLIPLLLSFFYPDAAIILVVGMVPSVVAMAVTQGLERGQRVATITLFNLAGVLHILIDLQSSKYAGMGVLGPIGDVYVWFVMYGAAGVGIAVNWVAPIGAAAILTYLGRLDIHKLRSTRNTLIKEWGDGVGQKVDQPGN